MSSFKKFYIWGMNAKFFMGIYFSAIVFLAGILTACFGGNSLSLWVLLEMILVSAVIAFTQVWILPDSTDFGKGIFFGRSMAWLLFAGVLVIAVSLLGGWFAGLPAWCSWLLGLFMIIGCSFMLLGLKFEQDADTMRLNDSLQKYQKK